MTFGAGISVADRNLNVLETQILTNVHDNVVLTPAMGDGMMNGAFIGVFLDHGGSHNVFPIGKLHHFNKNLLSGTIPESLFSSQMQQIHVLLDANNFTGKIPTSIGLVQSLEVLRLDRNSLSGPVPFSISNLTSINELNLANNRLSGPIPNIIRL